MPKRGARKIKDDSLEIEGGNPNQIQLQNILDLLNESKESEMIVPQGLQVSEPIQKLLKIMEKVEQKKAIEQDSDKKADLDMEFEQCLLQLKEEYHNMFRKQNFTEMKMSNEDSYESYESEESEDEPEGTAPETGLEESKTQATPTKKVETGQGSVERIVPAKSKSDLETDRTKSYIEEQHKTKSTDKSDIEEPERALEKSIEVVEKEKPLEDEESARDRIRKWRM